MLLLDGFEGGSVSWFAAAASACGLDIGMGIAVGIVGAHSASDNGTDVSNMGDCVGSGTGSSVGVGTGQRVVGADVTGGSVGARDGRTVGGGVGGRTGKAEGRAVVGRGVAPRVGLAVATRMGGGGAAVGLSVESFAPAGKLHEGGGLLDSSQMVSEIQS